MKSSFLQAGFTEEKCRYQVFDNSIENCYDPYQTITHVLATATEPYVLFCHQDVLLNKGVGFDHLVSQLDSLSRLDPQWAIAGNAGSAEDLAIVIKITDPNGVFDTGNLPQKVCSLDENFLVLRTDAHLRCSEALSGFHLYASDLCLQAMRRGFSAYVIDFHLTHLSGGNSESADFKQSLTRFQQNWNPAFTLCLMNTPCTMLTFFTLSRSGVIRRLLRSARVLGWIKRHIKAYVQISHAKKQVRQTYMRLKRTA